MRFTAPTVAPMLMMAAMDQGEAAASDPRVTPVAAVKPVASPPANVAPISELLPTSIMYGSAPSAVHLSAVVAIFLG